MPTLHLLAPKIALLGERLCDLAAHPHVGKVRQRGFMVGIELVADKETREPFPVARRTAHRVTLEARQLGAIIRPLGDVLILMPPLCITNEELDTLCRITHEAIQRGTSIKS